MTLALGKWNMRFHHFDNKTENTKVSYRWEEYRASRQAKNETAFLEKSEVKAAIFQTGALKVPHKMVILMFSTQDSGILFGKVSGRW